MTAPSHDRLRTLMFSVAYRMLGSVADAEDVVQEAFLRLHTSEADGTATGSADAVAVTVTTRLAIDALRSARLRREQYVGPWLPDPLVAPDDGGDPAFRVETDETVTTAFLVLLETLTPAERAVFVLREAFGYGYGEIATVLEKSETNCRQILARARRAVDARRPRFDADRQHNAELARRFLAAANDGDVDALTELLAQDVVFVGDGGGRAPSVQKPVQGDLRVTRFVVNLAEQALQRGMRVDIVEANGQAAWRVHGPAGEILALMTFEIAGGRIRALHNVVNPDKLAHLGPVGDLAAVLGRQPRAYRSSPGALRS